MQLDQYIKGARRGLAEQAVAQKVTTKLEDPGLQLQDDTATLTLAPDQDLSDIPALLGRRGLNPAEWDVERVTVNEWESSANVDGDWLTVTLHQLKAVLKPLMKLVKPARLDGPIYSPSARPDLTLSRPKLVVQLPDQQAPYHDRQLHEMVCEWLRHNTPDAVILSGDLYDFPSISRHRRNLKLTTTAQQSLDGGYGIVRDYRQATPLTPEWVLIPGNHEVRLENFLLDRGEDEILQLRRAGDGPEVPPVLSLTHLGRLDQLGLELASSPYGSYPFPHYALTPDFDIYHGWIVRPTAGASALVTIEKLGKSAGVGHCFDEETEILTPEGWVSHDRLSEESIVMTLDRATNQLVWNPVQAVYRYDHFKELVHLKGNNVDLAMTDGHGLWAKHAGIGRGNRRNSGWHETTVGEAFGHRLTIPLAGEHDQECLPLSDAWIELLAWIMAEGSIQVRDSKTAGIRIAQSDAPDGRLQMLESCLTACGLTYSKILRYHAGETEHRQHRNFDAYRLGILECPKIRDIVEKYLGIDKTPTIAMSGMSLHQMRVFLDTYVMADGSINKASQNSRQIGTNRKDHADWLQQIAVRSGHRSSLIQRPRGMYCLTINSRTTTRLGDRLDGQWSRQPYDGIVWCVSVSNGTLVVRRRGKTAITLNTHRGAIVHLNDPCRKLMGVEAGALAQIEGGLGYDVAPNWENCFPVYRVYPNTQVHPSLAFYREGELLWEDQRYYRDSTGIKLAV